MLENKKSAIVSKETSIFRRHGVCVESLSVSLNRLAACLEATIRIYVEKSGVRRREV